MSPGARDQKTDSGGNGNDQFSGRAGIVMVLLLSAILSARTQAVQERKPDSVSHRLVVLPVRDSGWTQKDVTTEMNVKQEAVTMNTVAERFESVRMMLHLNRGQFADFLGITGSLVGCMEKGTAAVSRKTTARLTERLGINPIWLQYGMGDMFIRSDISLETILSGNPASDRFRR